MQTTRTFGALAAASAALALAACASFGTITAEVWSYSQWPAGRKPTTYAFERLPSQRANPDAQSLLEAAARGAIEAELGRAVYLELGVRVRRRWRRDEALLDRLGIE